MPTKTRSPSRISREAMATISSCAEYSVIAEVRRHRQPGLLDPDGLDVDAPHVVPAIADPQDPFLQPGIETFDRPRPLRVVAMEGRSEEHTSELQSHSDLVCRLLLEKKKTKYPNTYASQSRTTRT